MPGNIRVTTSFPPAFDQPFVAVLTFSAAQARTGLQAPPGPCPYCVLLEPRDPMRHIRRFKRRDLVGGKRQRQCRYRVSQMIRL